MINPEYKDPIAELLIEKFKEFGHKDLIKNYYTGTPMVMAQNQLKLPAVFISGAVDSDTRTDTNTHDESVILYRATIVMDMKEAWLKGTNRVGAEMEMHKYLAGRDQNFDMLGTSAADGRGSLEYVVRKHHILSGDKRVYIDLKRGTKARIQPNIEGRGSGMYLYEGILEFAIVHNQLKP